MIPLYVLECDELHALKQSARYVLLAIAAQFNGYNNGHMTLTSDDGKRYGIVRPAARSGGLRDLELAGLIVKTHQGGLRPFGPTRWAVPWHPLNYRNGKQIDPSVPTHVWARQSWAIENMATSTETVPCTTTEAVPDGSANEYRGGTAECPVTSTDSVPQSRLSPRGHRSSDADQTKRPALQVVKP